MTENSPTLPRGELKFWLTMTRLLPALRGTGTLARCAAGIYNRRKRSDVVAKVHGFEMVLDSTDSLERELLFCPQIYDRHEVQFLEKHLKPGDTFLDAGANVGLYSLAASKLIGESGKIVAIEADPQNAARLATNLKLNGVKNVRLANVGLSDRSEVLRLGLNTTGNRSGHSFLSSSENSVTVQCKTLTEVLVAEGIQKLDGAKMDIEGFEFKVLQRFFEDGNKALWPRFLLIEINPYFQGKTGGDVAALLKQNGYQLTPVSELNYFATRA